MHKYGNAHFGASSLEREGHNLNNALLEVTEYVVPLSLAERASWLTQD